ncbi:MAG TPA: recombinase RecT [Trebonia sp.]|nr:recombinase RecT [Trebonia sp.]
MTTNGNGSNGLRERVAQQREKTEQQGGGEVERRQPATIASFIESMKGEMARALPKHLNPDRLARIALTEVRRTPRLAECTQSSFGGALMTCAQLGLEPGVTGEAYLIPRKNGRLSRNAGRDVFEVQLTIGYQGMAKLFWQSPLAKSLDAQAVYENDDFGYEYGLNPMLRHVPTLQDRGNAIAYYAVATLTNGGFAFVVLSRSDVEKIRIRSNAGTGDRDSPWKTDYDEMAKKTCLRRMFKLLPKAPELARALSQDEGVRSDWAEDAIDIQPEYPDAVAGEVEHVDESEAVNSAQAGAQ